MLREHAATFPPIDKKGLIKALQSLCEPAIFAAVDYVGQLSPKEKRSMLLEGNTLSPRELRLTDLPPIQFSVDEVLPVGLTLLVGRPKGGKSWLALQLGIDVALGRAFLGKFAPQTRHALYLALEDSDARLSARQDLVMTGEAFADSRPDPELYPTTLLYRTNPDRMSMDESLVPFIREYVRSLPSDSGSPLVIIDIFERIRGRQEKSESYYQYDYRQARALQELGHELGVAILLLHHDRKAEALHMGDKISGTKGMYGAADGMLMLDSEPDGGRARLTCEGRDHGDCDVIIKRAQPKPCGVWSIDCEVSELGNTGVAGEIAELVRSYGPLDSKDICSGLNANASHVRSILADPAALKQMGVVRRGRRRSYRFGTEEQFAAANVAADADAYRRETDGE